MLGVCPVSVLAAAAAWAEDAVFDVPRLENITVDGDASDWGDRGFHVGLLADEKRNFKDASDFDGRLWLGWDDAGLLVRAEGRDDQHVESEEDWAIWAKDAVELFMAIEPGSTERYQIVVAPGHTKEQPDLRIQYYEFRHDDALLKTKLTGEAAATRVGDRYILEVRMPWSNLAITPKPGASCGFQIYLNDFDPDDPPYLGRYTAMWYPGGQSNWNPERMYRVRLADTPSAPVLAMGTARAFTETSLLWLEMTAAESLAGHSLTISGSGFKETAVTLEAFRGRAAARAYVPTGATNYDPAKVTLAIDGTPVANVARSTEGSPAVDFDIAQTSGEYTITPRLEPIGAFPAHKAAKVKLYDAQGQECGAYSLKPGESARVRLEKGLYLVTGRYPGQFERPIEGARGFAVGYPEGLAERLAELRATEGAVRDRANDGLREVYEGYWLYSLDLLRVCIEERPLAFSDGEADFIEWLIRPQVDPAALSKRRGEFEWAYRSKVDGTGQPFSLWVPYTYDAKTPYPMRMWLHGSGGTHKEVRRLPGTLLASVLGRSRAQGYGDLCGVDVREVYEYVLRHWSVDADRVGIFGASMGGGGTFDIASLYPDLFAAASPWMGYADGMPTENLSNVPVYALHGTHDRLVPIGFSRTGLQNVEKAGGMTVMDALPKTDHGFVEKDEARAHAWMSSPVRKTAPERIHYKALHNGATGAYGVNVLEWGAEWRPATFDAARDGDMLYLRLDNIRVLEVNMTGIARVSVNEGLVLDVPGPDNGVFYVVMGEKTEVCREKPAFPAEVLNTPGGPHNLYHGDPLLVVWGTKADEETNRRIFDVADRLRRSPRPVVLEDEKEGDKGRGFMMHGKLYGKPDTEVTDEDLRNHSIILVGTAKQNAVAARLADRLPLIDENGVLKTSDGVTWPSVGRGWAFAYYNPVAPQRRLFWLASETPGFYRPNMPVLFGYRYPEVSPDLVIGDAEKPCLVAQRTFTPRWQWWPEAQVYETSPLLPSAICMPNAWENFVAKAILEQTGADASIMMVCPAPDPKKDPDECAGWTPGATRAADARLSTYWTPLVQFGLTSGEMAELPNTLREMKPDEDGHTREALRRSDTPQGAQRVVATAWNSWSLFTKQFEWNDRLEQTDYDMRDVLNRALDRLSP